LSCIGYCPYPLSLADFDYRKIPTIHISEETSYQVCPEKTSLLVISFYEIDERIFKVNNAKVLPKIINFMP